VSFREPLHRKPVSEKTTLLGNPVNKGYGLRETATTPYSL
jgi:hypothetical protein